MRLSTIGLRLPSLLRHGVVAVSALLTGCSALPPSAVTPPQLFTLDDRILATDGATHPPNRRTAALTLVVGAPRAAAGFEGNRIIDVRTPHRLEHFAHSDWVDTPSRMLAPLTLGIALALAVRFVWVWASMQLAFPGTRSIRHPEPCSGAWWRRFRLLAFAVP